MRLRQRRRLEKGVRRGSPEFRRAVAQRRGSQVEVLRNVMLDSTLGWGIQLEAAQLLRKASQPALQWLLAEFHQNETKAVWEIGMVIEELSAPEAVPPLVRALRSNNPDRQIVAARTLGWMRIRSAVDPLLDFVVDAALRPELRGQAIESLAMLGAARALPVLHQLLKDPEPEVRFWAIFAIGTLCNHTPWAKEHVPALESMLDDNAMVQGWYTVGREALGMLSLLQPEVKDYRARVAAEAAKILADASASHEDRFWAAGFL